MLFHDISPEVARQTFTFLAKRYNIISINDFVQACHQNHQLPDKAMILTFDDGHLGNYGLLTVIRELNIPVSIYLCAGIMDTNRHYWFAFPHPEVSSSALKKVSNKKKLEILAAAGFHPEKEFPAPQAMNKGQIEAMKPFVSFQAHTMFHPILPQCDDSEANFEIAHAKRVLEEQFELEITAIAYPNGDYSERDIAIAREAGYQCGITVDYGFNTTKSDLFRLKRLSVNDTNNLDELSVKASGVWAFFKQIFK
ncbi:MAG: hypothetical protein DHS20C18_09220 [Saprospiraceae bacterium]|nr:MAG: hypothetical protein DHS20C18_09220 [Saprospiraceae bacterium]